MAALSSLSPQLQCGVDVLMIVRVSAGRQRSPPAQRLSGEAQGRFAPQQRAAGEETAGQWTARTPQHQVSTEILFYYEG